MNNKMTIKFDSISQNEAFARNVIASFILPLNPSLGELSDIKTAVSEAVTNAIVHGYPDTVGEVTMEAEIVNRELHISISDCGVGIEDLNKALEPFFTSKPDDERSGMGFTIIKTFMDEVNIVTKTNLGTTVNMVKSISKVAV